jgi:hypothetical protein
MKGREHEFRLFNGYKEAVQLKCKVCSEEMQVLYVDEYNCGCKNTAYTACLHSFSCQWQFIKTGNITYYEDLDQLNAYYKSVAEARQRKLAEAEQGRGTAVGQKSGTAIGQKN